MYNVSGVKNCILPQKLKSIVIGTTFVITVAIMFWLLTLKAFALDPIEWDGKKPITAETLFTVSDRLVVTKDFVIPEGARLNVKAGGTLIVTRGANVNIKGELAISVGGTLELKSGTIKANKNGKLSIYGDFLQYAETTLDISKASFSIYNMGYYKSSGELNIFPESSFSNKGYIIMTRMSVATITGNFENTTNAQMHLQGLFKLTKSSALSNKGYMTIGANGEFRNSGTFTLENGSGYNRFGTVVNTQSGVFVDLREQFAFENMTVAVLVDEPRVVKTGIDVSYAQGDINWNKVSAQNLDFAIIRAARGKTKNSPMKTDDYFVKNIEGALANGMDVGVYFYSYATTVAECRAEARFLVDVIRGYNITYPIVLDMEEDMGNQSVQKTTEMIEAFFEVIMENGYFPMLYSYKSWFEQYLDMTILDKYAIWLAQINDTVTYQGGYYMWQYSWTGKVSGIKGDVDLNKSYRDFPDIFRRYGLNKINN